MMLTALIFVAGAVSLLGALTARLINHALIQVTTLTDTGAGPPPPQP